RVLFRSCVLGTPLTSSSSVVKPISRHRCGADEIGLTTLELLVNGVPKTQQISAVISDLEGPESIACIGQFPKHGNPFANELCVQGVGIVRVDVGVPASPFVTRTIRLWMDLGRDGLEHEHDSVASKDGPEVVRISVASTLIT